MHKIIERFDFQNDNEDKLLDLIIEELNFFRIDASLALKVREGILRIINVSLGGKLLNKKFIDISSDYILIEFKYNLTLSYSGKNINSNDISECFLLDQELEFGESYSNKIKFFAIFLK